MSGEAFKRNDLATFCKKRAGLRAGLAIALLSGVSFWSVAASAQAAAEEAPAEEDVGAIIVTGSRIRGVAPVGSNLIGVSQEAIRASGATTTSDLLKEVPQVTSLSFNAEGASGQGAAGNITRATAPNLRGLGQTATLVLLDGRRVPSGGTQGQFVDPSMIPPLVLARVEVIADGASAIYGSDAVAGVINLIPRNDYDGMEVRGRVGVGADYHDYQISAVIGKTWDSGNFLLGLDRSFNTALMAADRDFVSADRRHGGGADARSTSCSPGTVSSGGNTYALPVGQNANFDFNSLTAGTVNRCETEDYGYLLPETARNSVYVSASQDLSDTIGLFARGFYSKRTFEGPRGSQSVVTSVTVPTTNPYYPVNAPGPVIVSTNFIEDAGVQYTHGYSETWQVSGGLKASLGEWEVRVSGSYGRGKDYEKRGLGINTAALTAALANSDPASAINPFASPGYNDPDLLRSIYLEQFTVSGTSTLQTIEVGANGPLMTLPGGIVRLAIGGEYRDEHLDGVYYSGPPSATRTSLTDIGRNVKAVYGELFVPIIGDNAMPGIQSLSLLAALRYEEYSDFGTTTNPKIGLNWSPVSGITVRGSYGTSFRAPGLSEVDPNSSGAGLYRRTYTIGGQTLDVVNLVSGNPDVRPENATTWSAGFDITPAILQGVRFSATWFKINYKNQIVDTYGIITQVLTEPQNFADIIYYNDGSARYQQGVALIENSGFYTPGSIDFTQVSAVVDARKQNLASTQASGFDFEMTYAFSAGASRFTLLGNATLFTKYANATGLGASTDRLNTLGYPQRFRGRGSVRWELGGISAQASVNYSNAYRNATSTLVTHVPSYTTVDLDLAYTIPQDSGGALSGTRIGLNARNLFDREPNFVDYSLGYDPSVASALGRVVSLSVSKEF